MSHYKLYLCINLLSTKSFLHTSKNKEKIYNYKKIIPLI